MTIGLSEKISASLILIFISIISIIIISRWKDESDMARVLCGHAEIGFPLKQILEKYNITNSKSLFAVKSKDDDNLATTIVSSKESFLFSWTCTITHRNGNIISKKLEFLLPR